MLGHLMEWFYSGLGGIRQDTGSNSYKKIIISPALVGDIEWAEARYRTVHGEILSSWKLENDTFTLRVNIPVNCIATIELPSDAPETITENGNPVLNSESIKGIRTVNGITQCLVGSGEYLFRAGNIIRIKR